MISQELLDILVCPACKTKVVLEDALLVCTGCGRCYPIRDGIPVMLIEEGDKLRRSDGSR
ncbi:MAG: Trm112 family protein [Chloroflexota bacterium]